MNNSLIISQLSSIFDAKHILTDDDSKNYYGKDLTTCYTPNPIAIVFPTNEQQIVDLASKGSCQIGGNIATNAGGIKVVRYGLTRHWVAGLRVVTGNGDIIDCNQGLIKNACGYDLRQLFIGSEGTLGFITEALMQLIPLPPPSRVFLCAIPNKKYFMSLLNAFKHDLKITAFEFFSDKAAKYVMQNIALQKPFENMQDPFYILVEYESNADNDEKALFALF